MPVLAQPQEQKRSPGSATSVVCWTQMSGLSQERISEETDSSLVKEDVLDSASEPNIR